MANQSIHYAEMVNTARTMIAHPKGILAADESSPTLTKRFEALGLSSTEDSRRDWRETLFDTPGLAEFISGVICYDETFNQTTSTDEPFCDFLNRRGMLCGIKVDTGAKPLAGCDGELVTEGLDNLGPRLERYYRGGARFAKWRAVLRIADAKPSAACIASNATALARYAKLCQTFGLVPIVEPEILIEGQHDLAVGKKVATTVLVAVFDQLRLFEVAMEAIVLKPSMVTPGAAGPPARPDAIAKASIDCYLDAVPASVAGIALLSGGQSDEDATANLAAINAKGSLPWPITFSFGRALQDAPLRVWASSKQDRHLTQAALMTRVQAAANALKSQDLVSI